MAQTYSSRLPLINIIKSSYKQNYYDYLLSILYLGTFFLFYIIKGIVSVFGLIRWRLNERSKNWINLGDFTSTGHKKVSILNLES